MSPIEQSPWHAGERQMQHSAGVAERMAMVTPEENTGSRNSAALPKSAKPGPCKVVTFAE